MSKSVLATNPVSKRLPVPVLDVPQGTPQRQAEKLLPLPVSPSLPKPQPKTGLSFEARVTKDIFDSLVRATGRLFEMEVFEKTESNSARVGIRFPVEIVRKLTENLLGNLIDDKKMTRDDVVTSFTRALENTVGSAVFEPYLFTFPKRVGIGALNMAARFATRGALYGAGVIKKADLGMQNLKEEFFSRTAGRAIWLPTEGMPFGKAVRFAFSALEQLAINFNLHMGRIADKTLDKLGVSKMSDAPVELSTS